MSAEYDWKFLCPDCYTEHTGNGFIPSIVRCGCGKSFSPFVALGTYDNDRTTNQYAQIDNVNHPEHYAGTVECIDAMEACANPEQFIGYCRLCAFKYLWRAGKKGDAVTDYKKAIWYLERLVKAMEAR